MEAGKEIKVEILEVRLTNTNSSLRAFVDVKVGDWIINDWRVWKKNNGGAYVSVPQSTWKNPDGSIKFKPILKIPDEQMQKITTAILHAYYQEEEKNKWNQEFVVGGPK
jgi:DNA-binding cell septation regulator SpoVG